MSVMRKTSSVSGPGVAHPGALVTTYPTEALTYDMTADERSSARNISVQATVTGAMEMLRGVLPFVRPIVLAAIATALIMIGLPTVLALGAAAGT